MVLVKPLPIHRKTRAIPQTSMPFLRDWYASSTHKNVYINAERRLHEECTVYNPLKGTEQKIHDVSLHCSGAYINFDSAIGATCHDLHDRNPETLWWAVMREHVSSLMLFANTVRQFVVMLR